MVAEGLGTKQRSQELREDMETDPRSFSLSPGHSEALDAPPTALKWCSLCRTAGGDSCPLLAAVGTRVVYPALLLESKSLAPAPWEGQLLKQFGWHPLVQFQNGLAPPGLGFD